MQWVLIKNSVQDNDKLKRLFEVDDMKELEISYALDVLEGADQELD